MVIVEATYNPIVLNEATSILFIKTKIDSLKDKIDDILFGDLNIKDPEDQKTLDKWMNDHENDLRKLRKALQTDFNNIYNSNTDTNDFLITLAIVIASAITLPFSLFTGFVLSCIGLLYSTLVVIKRNKTDKEMIRSINAIKKIQKEMKKVDIKKIKNENLRERYKNLLDEIENTIDEIGE